MALKLGELTAFLKADDSHFQRGLKAAKDKFHKHAEQLKDTAKVSALAIGAALGAGIAGSLELNSAKAKLAAQLGGDTQYAADMGRIAGQVYSKGFGESAEEAMAAVSATLSSGLLDEDAADADIERITTKAQALAGVFGQDVTQAARAAGQMIRTGMASNADEAFDILTRGFQQSGDLAGDLLDTVNEYSTKFRDLGLNGQQSMGLLTQGIKAGARDIDTVADSLKEFSIRAIDGSKATSDGFKMIGLDAQKMAADIAKGGPTAAAALDVTLDRLRAMKDPVQQSQAAVALFGTKAEDLGKALYSLDPSSAVDALGQVDGAASKMANTMEKDAGQRLEAFKRKAQQALVEKLGEALPVMEKVGKFASDNSAPLTALGIVLGGIAITVWTINAAVAAWTAIQSAAAIATGAWTVAQWLLNVAMMANPVGLIILAIIALIAIIWVIWNHSSAFRDFWIAVWHGIVTGVKAAVSWITDTAWPAIKGFFVGIGEWVAGAYHSVVDWLGKAVSYIAGLPARMGKAAAGMFDGLKESARSAINWIIGKWNGFSLTLGGGTIMGVSIPSVTLNTPNIPMLADGGVVRATPGGRLAVVGEGREDEAVVPLSKLAGMGGTARVVFDTGGDPVLDALFRVVRYKVKFDYGGDLKEALGGKAA